MNRLTPGEEKLLLALWKLEKATVKEIAAELQNKSVVYNTVSTMVRILEKKKFIKHRCYNRKYIYYPKISKESYSKYLTQDLLDKYYNNKESFIGVVEELHQII
jgi:predicted transcriptional regulator